MDRIKDKRFLKRLARDTENPLIKREVHARLHPQKLCIHT